MTVPCDVVGCKAQIESNTDEIHVCGRCNGTGHASTQASARQAGQMKGKRLRSIVQWHGGQRKAPKVRLPKNHKSDDLTGDYTLIEKVIERAVSDSCGSIGINGSELARMGSVEAVQAEAWNWLHDEKVVAGSLRWYLGLIGCEDTAESQRVLLDLRRRTA